MQKIIIPAILLVSLAANAGLGWFVFKKGVTVNNTYYNENHQHQNQQQSMTVFSDTSIKNIQWKYVSYRNMAKVVGLEYSQRSSYDEQTDINERVLERYSEIITPWETYICKPMRFGVLFGTAGVKK